MNEGSLSPSDLGTGRAEESESFRSKIYAIYLTCFALVRGRTPLEGSVSDPREAAACAFGAADGAKDGDPKSRHLLLKKVDELFVLPPAARPS